ncbi:Kinase superfamily protein, putative isoform 2 [Hibiscus syriacus]|uniref:Kinase superfamily protein, putative isoform 2 n=1 Tax=Hibiscus syriacus TaxID=106335 RepID=A0A6A3C0P9_HIBSY|nr:Kinase superfamily protein, putative isoform 2 [Hibiscus syriacus]
MDGVAILNLEFGSSKGEKDAIDYLRFKIKHSPGSILASLASRSAIMFPSRAICLGSKGHSLCKSSSILLNSLKVPPEYIRNGTVADHLHGDLVRSGLLTWPIRMNIAIETASALAYLHASDIIHRDGTPGYVDPEYHQCYQLTGKSDVYSFRVVLVELVSSMPAVDISRHRHEINLANLAINKIQKCAFDELIDPNLGYNSDDDCGCGVGFSMLSSVQEEEHINDEIQRSIVPPPSPPTGDKIALLKNIRLPSSPVSVTDKWISRDTTPNATG